MQQADGLSNLGLLSGKMGIIIFFSHYHTYAQNEVFDDMASSLTDEVFDKIHKKLPFGFETGLAGIGWAIEYLIQNKFVEGSSLEVCDEIDKMIMKTDPRRLGDLTLETGIAGLLHYVLAHIQGVRNQTGKLPFDDNYLKDIHNVVCTLDRERTNKNLQSLINQYTKFYQTGKLSYTMDIKPFLRKRKVIEKNLLTSPLGIKDGLSGLLLNKIIT